MKIERTFFGKKRKQSSEAYLEPSQTYKMQKVFVKIANG